jgi:hypothetical protein
MENQPTFCGYYRRFCMRLAKDATPWARDNIGFAGTMFLLPIIAVYIHDRGHEIDWELVKTTLWFYLCAFGVYVIYHAIRTPWKLDLERKNYLLELQAKSISLTAQVADLQRESEIKIPRLHLDVWEVLIIPHINSVEVFVDASAANNTPNTQTTVRQFNLALNVAGRQFKAQKNKVDLDEYRIIDRRDTKTIEPRNFRFTVLDDLAVSMNEKNPILHGVPHRGWLHFSFMDVHGWPLSTNKVLSFMPIPTTPKVSTHPRVTFGGYWIESNEMGVSIDSVESAIVSIDDYLGSGANVLASVNKTGDHLIVKV